MSRFDDDMKTLTEFLDKQINQAYISQKRGTL